MGRIARSVARGVAVAGATLVLAEALLRVTVEEDALLDAWERRDGWVAWEKDGPALRPGSTSTLADGPYAWEVRVNALGLREDGDTPRRATARRVLALGDSWMFGNSITQGRTIPDRLEVELTERLGRPVDVVNAGLVGASAFDVLRRWHLLSAQLDVDGVLLGQPHNTQRQRQVLGRRAWWYADARAGPLVRWRLYLIARRALTPWRGPRYAAPTGSGDAADAELADTVALVRDARARGLPVWFAEFPEAWGRPLPDPARFRDALAPLGVRFGGHALPERACWGFEDLGHPSERGAHAIAAVLAEVIAIDTTLPPWRTAPSCDE